MGEFVVRHFSWDRRGKAFPPSPLPKDFQTLCPDFDMVVAEQAAEDYGLPELPQVDQTKLTRDLKPEPNDPDPYPTRHSKYAHPKVDPNPELTRPKLFNKVAYFGMTSIFHHKLVDPKLTRLEPYPTHTKTT